MQRTVHGTRFVAHGGHGKLFLRELTAFVFLKTTVYCSVYRLCDVAYEPLPGGAGRRRQLCFRHASLLQTLPEFGLPAAFCAVPLLALPQTTIERSICVAIRCGDKIRDPHINADHRRIWFGLNNYRLFVRHCPPPVLLLP